jgi:hypothetical protein
MENTIQLYNDELKIVSGHARLNEMTKGLPSNCQCNYSMFLSVPFSLSLSLSLSLHSWLSRL